MSFEGQQINGGPQGSRFAYDFYVYAVNFGNIAALATVTRQVTVQADSNFEWIMSTAYGNLNGATPPYTDNVLLPINLLIVDSGSSRQLFSDPVPLPSIAGTGKQPFILPVPRLFMAKSTIQLTAQNFDGTDTYDNVRLHLIGRKLFEKS